MDARPLAAAAGLLMLVALALAGAVLLGESSRIPASRHDLPMIASARPEPPPIISQEMRSDDAGSSAPPTPVAPLAPAPSPASNAAEPPADHAPQPAAQEQPPERHRHRVLRAAPAPALEPPAEPQPPAAAEQPPDGTRHAHRTLRAAPPSEDDQRQAELTPPSLEPVPPRPRPPAVDHRYDGVLTVAEIGRLKRSLRLTPEQEPYWPPVAALLREVGRRQMAQVDAGQRPTFDLPGDLSSRLYSAAMPLLGTLREDQKAVVRAHARSLGLGSVASFI